MKREKMPDEKNRRKNDESKMMHIFKAGECTWCEKKHRGQCKTKKDYIKNFLER